MSVGCLLRVVSEALAYSAGGPQWSLLPVSGFLELAAVIAFVINLAATLAQPTPAWFVESDVNAKLPLHWYVTSFPGTKSLLVREGLRTLAGRREVPRSLSLAEAAIADGADLDHLVAQLNEFFSRRRPRSTKRK